MRRTRVESPWKIAKQEKVKKEPPWREQQMKEENVKKEPQPPWRGQKMKEDHCIELPLNTVAEDISSDDSWEVPAVEDIAGPSTWEELFECNGRTSASTRTSQHTQTTAKANAQMA